MGLSKVEIQKRKEFMIQCINSGDDCNETMRKYNSKFGTHYKTFNW